MIRFHLSLALIIMLAAACKEQAQTTDYSEKTERSNDVHFESIDLVLQEGTIRGGAGYVLRREKADQQTYLRIDHEGKEETNLYSIVTRTPIRPNEQVRISYEYKPLEGFSGTVAVELFAPAESFKDPRFHQIIPAGAKEIETLPDGWKRVEATVRIDQPVEDVRILFPRIFRLTGSVLIRNIQMSIEPR